MESIEGEYRGRVSRESIEGEYRERVSRERERESIEGEKEGNGRSEGANSYLKLDCQYSLPTSRPVESIREETSVAN